ncbi:hypothetical protein DMH25_30405 [Streptomyces sp. WAC 01325]|uniref:DUF6082 family protein n=1 Tax=Streptomyces TaxID=1883 RepID=UPI000F8995FC|nr:DUF6082 family protein [Streptomyces sp. WAC 01325]RSM97716.1 hypothetical protein DMH25_30405 [Streptomyces sp. WAC 01325]WCH93572.1 DUF6082 family protein [Streptomyces moderatus]WSZ67696.1 DUF6082 family protein [Streptomyces chartreusis]WTA29437.1 DUF6082 family protein [Streptomyces chartreusis]
MATQNLAARSIGSALAAALTLLRAPFMRDTRRRQRDEVMGELLRLIARVGEELHYANMIQQHRLITEQMDRAIDDPALAAALSTLTGLSDQKRRQMLFANREYSSVVLAHRIGVLAWDELMGHLRILCRNPIFAEYWERTSEHRRSLPGESLDARVGKALDVILDELGDDPDEWWVVGT